MNKTKRSNKKEEGSNEKDKKLLLYSAVSFFLVLIVFLWLFNLPSILKSKTIEEDEANNFNWSEISDTLKDTWSSFSDNWSEVSKDLEKEVKDDKEKNNAGIFVGSTSTPEIATSTVDRQEFEDMQDDLKRLEEALEKANMEKQNNNCPQWVNCMPSYGNTGPNNCVIPPGCEGITEKVY